MISFDMIKFRCDKITDEGLKDLAVQIGTNLKNLTELELHFYQ